MGWQTRVNTVTRLHSIIVLSFSGGMMLSTTSSTDFLKRESVPSSSSQNQPLLFLGLFFTKTMLSLYQAGYQMAHKCLYYYLIEPFYFNV